MVIKRLIRTLVAVVVMLPSVALAQAYTQSEADEIHRLRFELKDQTQRLAHLRDGVVVLRLQLLPATMPWILPSGLVRQRVGQDLGLASADVAGKADPVLVTTDYDVRNLIAVTPDLGPGYSEAYLTDHLTKLLEGITGPQNWIDAGGTLGIITANHGVFTITNTQSVHRDVAFVLNGLDTRFESVQTRLQASVNNAQQRLASIHIERDKLKRQVANLPSDQASNAKLASGAAALPVDSPPGAAGERTCRLVDFFNCLDGLDMRVDWPSLQSAGVKPDLPVTLKHPSATLEQILRQILPQASETAAHDAHLLNFDRDSDGDITISTSAELDHDTMVVMYDLRDLLPSSTSTRQKVLQQIAGRILTEVAPKSWRDNAGEIGLLCSFKEVLIILQTRPAQDAIATKLGVN